MEQSIMNFRTIHPDWMPGSIDDEDSSAYVNRVNDPLRSVNAYRMGVTNARRPTQPLLGFAASSQMGQRSRLDQNRIFANPPDRSYAEHLSPRHAQSGLNPSTKTVGGPIADSDFLREMDERPLGQGFDSELGDSFMTPSQADEETQDEIEQMQQGVLGLLNHLYQETGTGKGIGM
jgi:hypothetical protein